MGRLRHRTELPSAGPSPYSMRAAAALSDLLLDTDELPYWPGGLDGLLPGERPYRRWVGPQGALHSRELSWFRHWVPICPGQGLIVDVTTHRLRVIPVVDVALRSIKRLEPRARDLSVLDVKLASGDRLRLWGEHVPELTVMLGWLRWHRVIAVPRQHEAFAAHWS